MTHEELLHGRPARISTRSTNGTPRTTCGAILPGTEPNRHVPANRRFYGARTRERPRRRVPCGRTDSSFVSFFVFVIRRSIQPRRGARGGGRTLDGTRPRPPARPRPSASRSPLPLRLALRTLDRTIPDIKTRPDAPPHNAIAPALAGNGRSSSDPRAAAPPAARRAHVPHVNVRTIKIQKLATFLGHT